MSSEYCAQSNVEDVFGVENVKQWSDLDNSGATDTDRVSRACDVASEMIDDVLRATLHKVPSIKKSDATAISDTIVNLAAVFAGIWLYEARGSQDYDPRTGPPVHRFEFLRARSEKMLENIRTGKVLLDAVKG